MSNDLTTLSGTEEAVWKTLQDIAGDPRSPDRILALGTQSQKGGGSVRMVVLRKADPANKTLVFYTHRRSGKVREIERNPGAEALYWNADHKLQIRLRGTVTISDGPDDVWDGFGEGTRANYSASPAAGEVISHPGQIGTGPDQAAFVVLTLTVFEVETLWLGGLVHHRALFTKEKACWLAP